MLASYLAEYTQAVPWPAQGPILYIGAKVPLRDKLLTSLSCCSSEEANRLLPLSLPHFSFSLSNLSFLPSYNKFYTHTLSVWHICYSP